MCHAISWYNIPLCKLNGCLSRFYILRLQVPNITHNSPGCHKLQQMHCEGLPANRAHNPRIQYHPQHANKHENLRPKTKANPNAIRLDPSINKEFFSHVVVITQNNNMNIIWFCQETYNTTGNSGCFKRRHSGFKSPSSIVNIKLSKI